MPLSLAQGATLANDSALRPRVAMAFYYVARNVLNEASSTANHLLRASFARSITQQDYSVFLQYTAMVVTDQAIVDASPATQAAITDGQITAAVTAMWDDLSGVV